MISPKIPVEFLFLFLLDILIIESIWKNQHKKFLVKKKKKPGGGEWRNREGESERYQILLHFTVDKAVCTGAWIFRWGNRRIPFIIGRCCGNVVHTRSCASNHWKERDYSVTKVIGIRFYALDITSEHTEMICALRFCFVCWFFFFFSLLIGNVYFSRYEVYKYLRSHKMNTSKLNINQKTTAISKSICNI